MSNSRFKAIPTCKNCHHVHNGICNVMRIFDTPCGCPNYVAPKKRKKSNSIEVKKISKTSKIWIFFEMNESDFTSTLRGIATDKNTKERFEIALTEEMKVRNVKYGAKLWWMVEENLCNHLYGASMYIAANTALRNSKYRVKNRQIDGD